MNISGNLSCINTRPYAQGQKNNKQIGFGMSAFQFDSKGVIHTNMPNIKDITEFALQEAAVFIQNLCKSSPDLEPQLKLFLSLLKTYSIEGKNMSGLQNNINFLEKRLHEKTWLGIGSFKIQGAEREAYVRTYQALIAKKELLDRN